MIAIFKTHLNPNDRINMKNLFFQHRYDFEVGYLVKSPCRECKNRPSLPGCADTCPILDAIHEILIGCVPSSKNVSALEDYALSQEGRGKK
jgi:hypothetical protein